MNKKTSKVHRKNYDGSRATRVQLSRLFGADSKLVTSNARTPTQWRKTLQAVLREIERYVEANVDTDEFHRMILFSGLIGAKEALKHDDFWPGYVEGITRFALILLGDYPDHRRRQSGRKDKGHYKLDLCRSVQWTQTPGQRLRTLIAVGNAGFPKLSAGPLEVLGRFRDEYGFRPSQDDFLEWYRRTLPEDYAAVFR